MFSSRGSSWPKYPTHVSCISCTGRWLLYQLCCLMRRQLLANASRRLIFALHNWGHFVCITSFHPCCDMSTTNFEMRKCRWDMQKLRYLVKASHLLTGEGPSGFKFSSFWRALIGWEAKLFSALTHMPRFQDQDQKILLVYLKFRGSSLSSLTNL